MKAIAVDASCLGNPGRMEYRGVNLDTGKEIFRVGIFDEATNNIGEFLAVVHALAMLKKENLTDTIVYTDSVTALAWVRNKKAKTKLLPTEKNSNVRDLIIRAETWLRSNMYTNRVMKWDTHTLGEIPADFGRK